MSRHIAKGQKHAMTISLDPLQEKGEGDRGAHATRARAPCFIMRDDLSLFNDPFLLAANGQWS